MAFEITTKTWPGKIPEITLGKDKGGGFRTVTIGGEETLPFHHFEGRTANRPVIALEVPDSDPENWIELAKEPYRDVLDNPVAWAKRAVDDFGADLLCLHLRGAHPDRGDRSAEECAELVRTVLDETRVPLIIKGPGPSDKQNEVLRKCGEAAEGEGCLLASAVEGHYQTLVATAIAYGHYLVAETPIDVNLAKQLNILISEMNLPPQRIVIDPLTGGLGYGLEYTYSVMERIRLQGLGGDPMLQMPMICFVGEETWKVKEVKTTAEDQPDWGDQRGRALLWEIGTAVSLLISGAGILVMRHPEAAAVVRKAVGELMGEGN
ncbi:MAG: acetyl-CoA decarbonylase/synthase complex subunit delta [Candidatus Eisenbacteria sp.]|nr:acetyl-CoA decarbonylase/synthase complex subunit delta [Candidatus Eisenbacteria bacterium]